MENENKLSNVINDVSAVLMNAKDYGLECEVIASALIYMNENKESTIKEALIAGLLEWDL